MQVMKCYFTPAKTLGLVIVGIAMVVAAWFCTTFPGLKPRVIGWIGLGFFGPALVVIAWQGLKPGSVVEITEEGIRDRRTSHGLVAWGDVTRVRVGELNGTRFLCIETADEEARFSRLSSVSRAMAAANRGLGFPLITISFVGLTPGIDEVWNHVAAAHPEKCTGG